jgi:carbonic anhydrase
VADSLDNLFQNNRSWADNVKTNDPSFFEKLAGQQSPEYLWIGCSDSRVPANQVVGLMPGEVFVHRNVANMVVHSDFNCLSVLQYAVEVLRVRHVMVVGHYGCGGVQAAYENGDNGLVDNWLRHVKDVIHRHRAELDAIADEEARVARLCELNVQAQVANVCSTTIVQNAWSRNQGLAVHGWIYGLRDGLLKDLGCTVSAADQIAAAYRVEG